MSTAWSNKVSGYSPKVWLDFDSTGVPTDKGSLSSSLTLVGSSPTTGVSSPQGSAYTFTGATRYSVSNSTGTFDDKVFTIEAIIKQPSQTSSQTPTIFRTQNTGASSYVLLRTVRSNDPNNPGRVQAYVQGGSGTANFFSSVAVDDGNWHHVALVVNGASQKIYVDGVERGSSSTTLGTLTVDSSSYTKYYCGFPETTEEDFNGSISEIVIYDSALTASNISELSGLVNYVDDTVAADPMNVTTATLPMPAFATTTVINVTYNSGTLTASADIVDPALSASSNLDAFGFMSVDPALFVDPDISVEKYNDYSASPATAEATSVNVTVSTTRAVDYSASPAIVSALLGGNVFAGPTVQDTSYDLDLRELGHVILTGTFSGGTPGTQITIGTQWDAQTKTYEQGLAIKAKSGVPSNGALIKVKFDNSHLTVYRNVDWESNRFNIYVFTSNPINSKTFTTMNFNDMGTKEYLYTTRANDDNGNQILDLTAAFADTRSNNYGIYIEHASDAPPANHTGTTYDRTEWSGSNLHTKLLYILTSEFVSKNINAAPMNATTAEMTAATVSVERYVNYSQTAATASGLSLHPTITTERTINFPADPSTASALSVEPTLDFSAVVEPTPMIAFGQIQNVVVTAIKNVNIQVDASTVTALLHMPQAQIGENNSVDHMNADALFVMPLIVINESVDAMVATVSGLMVQPSVGGQLLGVVFASPMTASALSPNPPAYTDLFADPWYATLYAQHSVRHGLPSGYGKAFLKLFEDQNTDITQSTPNTLYPDAINGSPTLRQLRNNVTWGMVVNSGPENDSSRKPSSPAITDYSTATNESRMSVGYFDNWNRKAIRLQNIAFIMQEGLGFSKGDFSMEFSIKTTKADQILSYGKWESATYSGTSNTTYNLVDGKLNYMTYSGVGGVPMHPKMSLPPRPFILYNQLTGNKQINDGQWHHVVIQYVAGPEMDNGILGRFQIWIDGELDIQRFDQFVYEPDVMGANISNVLYASDFYTSAWSLDVPGTISERDIDLHNFDFIKYEPIFAEPMTASLTMTSGNSGKGNRGRALMLYWWPTSSGQNKNFVTSRFDSPTYSGGGEFDISMSPQELETLDFIKNPPQQYYGWDVFPVDVNGYFVSDLVKEEAYGGAQNIIESDLGGAVLAAYEGPRPQFKANRRGYFRNTLDDTRRYLDLVNDIDLSQFDAIFFKNYPDQSNEIDAFAKNEIVDPYFNIRETKIYEDFIKSLRAAVDTGISLMINNPQLAIDLKIVDRIEVVPDLTDGTGYYSDPYTPTLLPTDAAGLPVGTGSTTNIWTDTYRNNRLRVLNTLDRLTNYRSVTYVDAAYWNNDDTLNYGGPNRGFKGFQYKENGLAVGDEFFISTFNFGNYTQGGGSVPRNYLATPIANVKSGTPITAFANQYVKGTELVDNPYKNYVTSIAVKPGDVLDGRQVGGKIWVNFTDAISQENEYVNIDAIHTDWINRAYNEGNITLTKRNQLLAQGDLLETQLSQGRITQSEYNKLSRWQSNGMYILTQTEQVNEEIVSKPGEGAPEKVLSRKFNKDGVPSTQVTYVTGPQFFSFTYARKYEQLTFAADSMNTRGLRWLSSRAAAVGQNQAHTAMPASATMIQPSVIAVRDTSVNVATMIANAIHVDPVGFAGADRNILSLPMTATALITQPIKIVSAVPMTAAVDTRQDIVIRTTAQDQVVVYVLHEDPILYLREDIIK